MNHNWYIEVENNGYQIIENGDIISYKRLAPILIKCHQDGNGYLQVKLCFNGVQKCLSVHKLLATKYIPNPDNLPQVNHKDGNIINNNIDNLEWCTVRYNCSNKPSKIKTTSKFVGVSFEKFTNRWMASIQINGKRFNLGRYNNEEEAYQAYLKKLKTIQNV